MSNQLMIPILLLNLFTSKVEPCYVFNINVYFKNPSDIWYLKGFCAPIFLPVP